MQPYIYIFGLPLSTYALMAIIGFAVSMFFSLKLAKVYELPKQDLLFSAVYMVIGIIVGSKLLYFITYIPKIITNFEDVINYPWQILTIVFGGFVFYGGLIGGALGVVIYAKQYKIDIMKFADTIAPVIPLFHAFGRIGCFLSGCCYGKEYHGFFAVKFEYNELVPVLSEVERFPVQLLESLLNIILWVILFMLARKRQPAGRTLGIYLICYTVIRTLTECLRGDVVRGVYAGGISTSQVISILLLPLGIWLVVRKRRCS